LLDVEAADDDGAAIVADGVVAALPPPSGSCDCDWEEAVEWVLMSMVVGVGGSSRLCQCRWGK
jgi:hypothetical protein